MHISYNTLCYHTITKQTWHPADAIAVELGVCRAATAPKNGGDGDRRQGRRSLQKQKRQTWGTMGPVCNPRTDHNITQIHHLSIAITKTTATCCTDHTSSCSASTFARSCIRCRENNACQTSKHLPSSHRNISLSLPASHRNQEKQIQVIQPTM